MKINRHILDNGLRLVHSQDESTQMVALNILYKWELVMSIPNIPVSRICLNI